MANRLMQDSYHQRYGVPGELVLGFEDMDIDKIMYRVPSLLRLGSRAFAQRESGSFLGLAFEGGWFN